MPDDARDLERTGRVVGAAVLSFVVLGVAVVLLLFPLGSIYDSDCGTLLQHPPTGGECADRAARRTIEIEVAVAIAAAFFLLALLSSRRKASVGAGGLMTVALVAALLLVGAPYAVSTKTSLRRQFDLHCPGRFTEYGGYEHPPAGTEHACGREANRRLAISIGILGAAAAGAIVLLRRATPHPVVNRRKDASGSSVEE